MDNDGTGRVVSDHGRRFNANERNYTVTDEAADPSYATTPPERGNSWQGDLRELLTAAVRTGARDVFGEPSVYRHLCLPLALLYNEQKLTDTSSLELAGIRFRGAMLQMLVGCLGEMIPPAQQLELLERTVTSCALVDECAGLLVIFGLTRLTIDNISVCLLE